MTINQEVMVSTKCAKKNKIRAAMCHDTQLYGTHVCQGGRMPSGKIFLFEACGRDHSVERPSAYSEQARGFRLIAPGFFQGPGNQSSFISLPGLQTVSRRLLPGEKVLRQVGNRNRFVIAVYERILYHMLKLPDISGPGIFHETFKGLGRNMLYRLMEPVVEALYKV